MNWAVIWPIVALALTAIGVIVYKTPKVFLRASNALWIVCISSGVLLTCWAISRSYFYGELLKALPPATHDAIKKAYSDGDVTIYIFIVSLGTSALMLVLHWFAGLVIAEKEREKAELKEPRA